MSMGVDVKLRRRCDLVVAGTAGVPGNYGGFETLAEQLVVHLSETAKMLVICSRANYKIWPETFYGARLKYFPVKANGLSSVLYDILGLLYCCWRTRCVLQLGVSGAIAIPIVKVLDPRLLVVCNVDGIEWRRDKWGFLARHFLKLSEWIAVKFSDKVIADNLGIADYLKAEYGSEAHVIPYGGDHAVLSESERTPTNTLLKMMAELDGRYFYSICRIVPENNVEKILSAFSVPGMPNLIFVGDWLNGRYPKELYEKYKSYSNIFLFTPIYHQGDLAYIRSGADGYIHGHSAGGTNPSLVEAMCCGSACIAYDCIFNAYTLDDTGILWTGSDDLVRIVLTTTPADLANKSERASAYAGDNYKWTTVAAQYREITFCPSLM